VQLPLILAQFGGAGATNILFFVGLFAIMYFVLIRPQQKQAKDQQNMLSALKKGDDVVTTGGMLGRVFEVRDKVVTLEVSQGTKVRVLKSSIQAVTPPDKKDEGEKKDDSKGEK
jgi:preprotein translocase subunit YajC